MTTNANDPSVKVAYFNMTGWEFKMLAFYWPQLKPHSCWDHRKEMYQCEHVSPGVY